MVTDLPAAGFDFRCGFGDASVAASRWVEAGLLAGLQCTSPLSATSGVVGLRLSLNGQQYATADAYTYYEVVTPLNATPASGPPSGGALVTIHGAGLSGGSAYRCRFGDEATGGASATSTSTANSASASNASVVNASFEQASASVQCVAPALAGGAQHALAVSLNAQQFVPVQFALTRAASYTVYPAVQIEQAAPLSGPTVGGTTIEINLTAIPPLVGGTPADPAPPPPPPGVVFERSCVFGHVDRSQPSETILLGAGATPASYVSAGGV